jgi:hypothetical protein
MCQQNKCNATRLSARFFDIFYLKYCARFFNILNLDFLQDWLNPCEIGRIIDATH